MGIGGDPVRGMNFIDVIELFERDPQTEGIVMVGEIGGSDEEAAAAHIAQFVSKPVVAYIAGVTAPPGKRMGHAGAVVSGGKGTAAGKFQALRDAGVRTVESPAELGSAMAELLGSRKRWLAAAEYIEPRPAASKRRPAQRKKAVKRKAVAKRKVAVKRRVAARRKVAVKRRVVIKRKVAASRKPTRKVAVKSPPRKSPRKPARKK